MKIVVEPNPEARLTPAQRQSGGGAGFVYRESSQPLYRTKVLLKNLLNGPELYINRANGPLYKIPQLIHYIKNIEFILAGKAHVHAGAVARDENRGILIFGLHKSGKTSLLLNLAQQGYAIVGDDSIWLSSEGRIEPMHSTVGVYPHPHRQPYLPLSTDEKVVGWFKHTFAKHPSVHTIVGPQIAIEGSRIGTTIGAAQLCQVIIVERGQPEALSVTPEVAVNRLLATSINRLIPDGFPKRLLNFYCFYNNISPTFAEDKLRQIFTSALRDKSIILLRGNRPEEICQLFLQHAKQ